MRPFGVISWIAEISFVSSMGTCAHLFTSSDVLTRMMDLSIVLSARWRDRYTTCHREFALVLLKVSIYGSWRARMSQLLCSSVLIMSYWALSDLFKFCCHICSLGGGGFCGVRHQTACEEDRPSASLFSPTPPAGKGSMLPDASCHWEAL